MQFTTFPTPLVLALALAAGLNTAFSAPTRREMQAVDPPSVLRCNVTHHDDGNIFWFRIGGVPLGQEEQNCDGLKTDAKKWLPGQSDDKPPTCMPQNGTGVYDFTAVCHKQSPEKQVQGFGDLFTAKGVGNDDAYCDVTHIPGAGSGK